MDTLLQCAVAFTITKSLFGFLGWLSEGQEDFRLRRQLDRLFDELNLVSLGELVGRCLRRFHRRWRKLVSAPRGVAQFVALSFSLNMFARLFQGYSVIPHHMYAEHFLWRELRSALWYGFAGLLPDLLFAGLSAGLLQYVLTRARNRFLLLAVVLVDVLLLVLAVASNHVLAAFCTTLATRPLGMELPSGYWAGLLEMALTQVWYRFGQLLMPGAFPITPADLVLACTSSLQTVGYLGFTGLILLARLCPRWGQALFARVVFAVTVDRAPVLSQLGTLTGAAAAIASALASLAR